MDLLAGLAVAATPPPGDRPAQAAGALLDLNDADGTARPAAAPSARSTGAAALLATDFDLLALDAPAPSRPAAAPARPLNEFDFLGEPVRARPHAATARHRAGPNAPD